MLHDYPLVTSKPSLFLKMQLEDHKVNFMKYLSLTCQFAALILNQQHKGRDH